MWSSKISWDFICLDRDILKCELCPDLIAGRLYPMPGFHGDGDIKLMIIGINPGPPQPNEAELLKKLEDDYEKHYEIGIKNCNVGEFLSKAFKALGVSWDQIFFTNIIKCPTPNVRQPNDFEINSCHKYLEKQVDLVSPKNILLLGKFPSQQIADLTPMSVWTAAGVQLISIYHPSYIRRKDMEKATLKFLSSVELR